MRFYFWEMARSLSGLPLPESCYRSEKRTKERALKFPVRSLRFVFTCSLAFAGFRHFYFRTFEVYEKLTERAKESSTAVGYGTGSLRCSALSRYSTPLFYFTIQCYHSMLPHQTFVWLQTGEHISSPPYHNPVQRTLSFTFTSLLLRDDAAL